MNSYVLDTNILSALVNRRDVLHQRAGDLVSSIYSDSNVIIPATVILELSLLQANYPEFANLDLFKFIYSVVSEVIAIDEAYWTKFNKFAGQTQLNLKTIDYSLLFTARQSKAELISFDTKLLKAWQKIHKHPV